MRSGNPPHQVVRQEQADRTVMILVEAFHDDPFWACAFPDVRTRRDHLRWLFRQFVEGALRYSAVWLTHDEVAVSVWIPPGGNGLSPTQETQLDTGLWARLGTGAEPVLRAFDAFDAHHPQDRPHQYLWLLATDSRHRGHGHGLQRLADNLAAIDHTGAPCYLEASNPVNVPLYQRFGFAIREHFKPFPDGPTVTTMWREPTAVEPTETV